MLSWTAEVPAWRAELVKHGLHLRQVLGDGEAESLEDARVKKGPKLAEAIHRQHKRCGYDCAKELRKDVHKGSVPVAALQHLGSAVQHTCKGA